MNTKHTPGPWHLARPVPSHGSRYVTDANGRDIARIAGGEPTTDADARLIAKAPEMAAELSETLDILRTIVDSAAIKTATNVPDEQKAAMLNELHERIAASRALLADIDGGTNAA